MGGLSRVIFGLAPVWLYGYTAVLLHSHMSMYGENFYMAIWLYGYMYVYGYVAIWLYGVLAVWLYGCMSMAIWLHGFLGGYK